ncbi:hypothetical protein [Verrucomicrobium sp. BvORR034]|uniref:hypothetical protein n=1 Tax=Verrucomicrobium sp. BvORR034 TaxID=1396418 RepID=UPI000678B1B1|nr:hypothetical protein [Verrucomicrobium sp. BvORR034]
MSKIKELLEKMGLTNDEAGGGAGARYPLSGGASHLDPAKWSANFEESSRKIEEVLTGWDILPNGHDNDSNPEVYSFGEAFAALSKKIQPPGFLMKQFGRGKANRAKPTTKDLAKAFAEGVAAQPKVDLMLQRMLESDMEQYDVFIVIPVGAVLTRDAKDFWVSNQVGPACKEFTNVTREAILEKADRLAISMARKPGNLKALLSVKIHVEVCFIDASGDLKKSEYVLVTKRRSGPDAVIFRLKVSTEARSEPILFAETRGVIDRASDANASRKPIRRAVYPENYQFYLCHYPARQVKLSITDIAVPERDGSKNNGGWRPPTKSKKLSVFEIQHIPGLGLTTNQLAEEIRRFTGRKLEVNATANDVRRIYQDWMSQADAGIKGNIAWLGAATYDDAKGWQMDAPKVSGQREFNRLRIDSLNYFPEFDTDAFQDQEGVDVHLEALPSLVEAVKASDHGPDLWRAATPPAKAGHAAAKGLFRIAFDTKKDHYILETYEGVAADLQFKVATRMELNPAGTDDPLQLKEKLLGFVSGELLRGDQKDIKQGIPLGNGVFYLAVGFPAVGYLLFVISTGSRTTSSEASRENSLPVELQQAHLVSFCEKKGITGLRKAFADRITTQGEIFVAEPSDAPGQTHFVKVFWGNDLNGRKKALRNIWPVLQDKGLLPPDIKCLAMNAEFREVYPEDNSSVVWLVVSPKFKTLEERLEEPLTVVERLELVNQLRQFYRRALAAGLAFPDCTAEDLVLFPDESGLTLIDFGSYLPQGQWDDDPLPRKDDYRDPAFEAWKKWRSKDLPPSRELLLKQHAYNLGLLQARVLTGELCDVADTPLQTDSQMRKVQADYETRLAAISGKIAETWAADTEASVWPAQLMLVQGDTEALLSWDVPGRPSPLDLEDIE